MAELGTYFIFSSLLFLLAMITNIIFYSKYNLCLIDSNVSSIYLIMILCNSFIFFLSFVEGLLINYFSSMDPSEFKSLGLIKYYASIICKILPNIIKFLHLLKLLIFFILSIMSLTLISNDTLEIDNDNADKGCGENPVKDIVAGYKVDVIIFYSIEGFVVYFTLCVLGMIKSYIYEEGFMVSPLSTDAGFVTKLFYKTLGP